MYPYIDCFFDLTVSKKVLSFSILGCLMPSKSSLLKNREGLAKGLAIFLALGIFTAVEPTFAGALIEVVGAGGFSNDFIR